MAIGLDMRSDMNYITKTLGHRHTSVRQHQLLVPLSVWATLLTGAAPCRRETTHKTFSIAKLITCSTYWTGSEIPPTCSSSRYSESISLSTSPRQQTVRMNVYRDVVATNNSKSELTICLLELSSSCEPSL